MIVSSGKGFQVKSESGKNLSKPGMSKGQAQKRLAQVEWFKKNKPVGSPPRASDMFRKKVQGPPDESGPPGF